MMVVDPDIGGQQQAPLSEELDATYEKRREAASRAAEEAEQAYSQARGQAEDIYDAAKRGKGAVRDQVHQAERQASRSGEGLVDGGQEMARQARDSVGDTYQQAFDRVEAIGAQTRDRLEELSKRARASVKGAAEQVKQTITPRSSEEKLRERTHESARKMLETAEETYTKARKQLEALERLTLDRFEELSKRARMGMEDATQQVKDTVSGGEEVLYGASPTEAPSFYEAHSNAIQGTLVVVPLVIAILVALWVFRRREPEKYKAGAKKLQAQCTRMEIRMRRAFGNAQPQDKVSDLKERAGAMGEQLHQRGKAALSHAATETEKAVEHAQTQMGSAMNQAQGKADVAKKRTESKAETATEQAHGKAESAKDKALHSLREGHNRVSAAASHEGSAAKKNQ